MEVDNLIIGQGICGTLLSWNLSRLGKSVLVIDNADPVSSSRVASGLINPITGKRHVKSWLYDDLLPAALESYRSLEMELKKPLLTECSLLEFHTSLHERETFEERALLMPDHLGTVDGADLEHLFRSHYGVGSIAPCWLMDGNSLLNGWRQKLSEGDQLMEERFDISRLKLGGREVVYKDIRASMVTFCEGCNGSNNPYFSLLPFSLNKGEAVIARIPGLPNDRVYKHVFKIVPWQDDLFWIGSSFVWNYNDVLPTAVFMDKVNFLLSNWVKIPYEIVDHFAAERPSSVDYKPFIGIHPSYSSMSIFNGMGTKGYSQAPYFANQLAEMLVTGAEIMPDVDVQRYKRILASGI